MLRAKRNEWDRQRRLVAQLGHWVFVAWRGTKDAPTVAELLGEPRMSPEDAEATLASLVEGEGPQAASVRQFDEAMRRQAERRR